MVARPVVCTHCGIGRGCQSSRGDVDKYKINIFLHAGEFPRPRMGRPEVGALLADPVGLTLPPGAFAGPLSSTSALSAPFVWSTSTVF